MKPIYNDMSTNSWFAFHEICFLSEARPGNVKLFYVYQVQGIY